MKEYVLFVTVVRWEINFTFCLTVQTKMSRETVPSMLINTHHPNVPKFCSLMNMTSESKNVKLAKFISVFLSYFDKANNETQRKKERKKK